MGLNLAEVWALDNLIKKMGRKVEQQELSGEKLSKVEEKAKQIVQLWKEMVEQG